MLVRDGLQQLCSTVQQYPANRIHAENICSSAQTSFHYIWKPRGRGGGEK